jgi:hypothetical protein
MIYFLSNTHTVGTRDRRGCDFMVGGFTTTYAIHSYPNTVVYFDWKTVIYIYVRGQCRTQFMLPFVTA